MSKDSTLRGVRVVSLALNLPGPAAVMRLAQMGANCTKVNPPQGDPMAHYTPDGYASLHQGVKQLACDLKDAKGQKTLHQLLSKTDVLLTSFRPSALNKLGLSWKVLHQQYPKLSCVCLVGAPGLLAEVPGHDLTYQAEVNLVPGMALPASLFADMGGAMMASEAVLKATLMQRVSGKGSFHEVALSDAAAWLALPRTWGMTLPKGAVGGAHAGYNMYACKNGRVAVAALEPHFAKALCEAAGIVVKDVKALFAKSTHQAIANFLASQTSKQLDQLAIDKDIPLMTLPKAQ
jgi:crotonobetainyl-CoA:carnitine CoA-transferase CaiB-like acyl-CoA transferase